MVMEKALLSKRDSDYLKSIFALGVFLHHCYQYSGLFRRSLLGGGFQILGYLSVSVFFFLSGYGLSKRKSETIEYMDTFWRRRILPYYVTYLITILVYLMFDLIVGVPVALHQIVQSLLFGDTIVINGWYFQTLLILYIIFFSCWRISPKYSGTMRFIGTITFCVLCVAYKLPTTWYEASFAFCFGGFWVEHYAFVGRILRGLRQQIFLAFVAAVTIILGNFDIVTSTALKLAIKMLSSILFASTIVVWLPKIKIDCFITRFAGKYYAEIYIVQGIFLYLFRSDIIYVQNVFLYLLLVTVSTMLAAASINPFYRYINKKVRFTQ